MRSRGCWAQALLSVACEALHLPHHLPSCMCYWAFLGAFAPIFPFPPLLWPVIFLKCWPMSPLGSCFQLLCAPISPGILYPAQVCVSQPWACVHWRIPGAQDCLWDVAEHLACSRSSINAGCSVPSVAALELEENGMSSYSDTFVIHSSHRELQLRKVESIA